MDCLVAGIEKLRRDGAGEAAIAAFRHSSERRRAGDAGVLPEREIEPLAQLPALDDLPDDNRGAAQALDHAVVLKLNGGLGTTMGMKRAKALLEVKDGLTFLDVIARQVLELRARSGARLPLVLMNSFHTREDSLTALEKHQPALASDVPVDFVQNRFPKLRADDLCPVSWPADPELEWAPPGHGDLYVALQTSGMLETLLDRDYRYAFVSNSDNLGAVVDPRILAWLAREQIGFLAEVADRTEADRKGGHLARRRGGGLVLREAAQTPEEDVAAFQDVRRHRFFNTNNLWIDLRALADVLGRNGGALPLPLIVNRKTVDPADPTSPPVIQLETAMGAAIEVFDDARALRVSRRRFAPVKTTNDLLAVRSDAYVLTPDAHVELAPERGERPPIVDLDPRFYKLLHDFEPRFPAGPPSLVACDRLTVVGDVVFGRGVVVRGSVRIEHAGAEPLRIEDGAVLEDAVVDQRDRLTQRTQGLPASA
jgi:UTP--glucose-1-phosphate uridylyltransferase